MVSWIDEFVGNSAAKLSIEFIPPSELGVDTAKWAEAGIETMVIGKSSSEVRDLRAPTLSYIDLAS
jgi:hypothetical protein